MEAGGWRLGSCAESGLSARLQRSRSLNHPPCCSAAVLQWTLGGVSTLVGAGFTAPAVIGANSYNSGRILIL